MHRSFWKSILCPLQTKLRIPPEIKIAVVPAYRYKSPENNPRPFFSAPAGFPYPPPILQWYAAPWYDLSG